MPRPKRILAAFAIAAAMVSGVAAPAVADTHASVAPQADDHASAPWSDDRASSPERDTHAS
ncbi:hypothetical protein [Streptomyces megasporus]|uniref:hypothetical protein n=1 Tax=Streptomyces megasporus TaxID=44060 RepID=UPI0004E0F07A|nr:hypothetical protein [Streptomyces megasporus]